MQGRGRWVLALSAAVQVALICGLAYGGGQAVAAPLPDGRAYELVSEPEKNGVDALLTTTRTRVAADGSAFAYAALGGFGDAKAVEVAADYVAVRSREPDPGSNGWRTHGITPVQRSLSFVEVLSGWEPLYTGPFSADLQTGLFLGVTPVADTSMAPALPNLYRRTDLLTPGGGSYALVTRCPLCEETNSPLTPTFRDNLSQSAAFPRLAGATPDFQHVLFESRFDLTADAPPQPPECDPALFPSSLSCGVRLYEWDHGTVRLVGILPDGTSADASIAGEGANLGYLTPGVISDGSDGHTRVFFTQPTDDAGHSLSQAGDQETEAVVNQTPAGRLYMRVDHSTTEQLNLSERTSASAFAPALFLDSSADGTRAFFMSRQALTNDAPDDRLQKLYMYDASIPGSDPHNLTFLNRDAEPGDGRGDVLAGIGASSDGRYFYFVAAGQLLKGGPLLGSWIYLWHDGEIRRVGPAARGGIPLYELMETGVPWNLQPREARVSPNGKTLLFSSRSGEGLTGYDHGACHDNALIGCRELYVYDSASGTVQCASCNPSGAPATGMATDFLGSNTTGGTRADPPNSRPLTDDGRRVFFSSPDALVPQDVNGSYDAYEYDVGTRTVSLLTSGKDPADSYFVNATASGDDVFIITRERLVGWDRDDAYDIYDVRIGGGFPEPSPPPVPCSENTCRAQHLDGPGEYIAKGSAAFSGAGNQHHGFARKRPTCKKGRVLKRVRGKRRCVKIRKRRAVSRAEALHKHRGAL